MPAAAAVSTRPVPAGTETSRSSTVSFTRSGMDGFLRVAGVRVRGREDPVERRGIAERAAAALHVRAELVGELPHEARHRIDGEVAQRTERAAEDPGADRLQEIEVGVRRLPLLDLLQELHHPARSLAAGRALAARLVHVELRRAQ